MFQCETTICQTGQVDFRVMLTFLEFYRAMVKLPSQVLLPLCAEWAVCASVLCWGSWTSDCTRTWAWHIHQGDWFQCWVSSGFWSDALFCVPRRQLARNRNGTLAEPWNYGPHTLLGCKASFVWQPLWVYTFLLVRFRVLKVLGLQIDRSGKRFECLMLQCWVGSRTFKRSGECATKWSWPVFWH